MKKNLIIALALVAGASLSTVDAAKKKKVVVVEQAPVVETFGLNNSSDSVSYAAGMAATQGLVNYLLQQKVDTAYMADFVNAVKETVAKDVNDPKVKAYLMGVSIAQQLSERMLPGLMKEFQDSPDSISAKVFYKGFTDALLQDTTFFKAADAEALIKAKADAAAAARDEKLYGANRKAGEEFLKENAKKDGVFVLPSGLQYKVLKQGTGAVPSLNDKVLVNYEGRLIDGTVFDSSYKRGEPADFGLNQVIPGWTEGVQLMTEGAKFRFTIPYLLAYGEQGAGASIPPFSTLIFDVELIKVL